MIDESDRIGRIQISLGVKDIRIYDMKFNDFEVMLVYMK